MKEKLQEKRISKNEKDTGKKKKRNEKVDGFKRMITQYLETKKLSLIEFFVECDQDKDGKLNYQEFQKLLDEKLLIGPMLESSGVQQMFEGCDIDCDQSISQLDFQRLFNQTFTTHQYREIILKYLEKMEINIETFFRQSDPESTGFISRKHFELVLKRMEKELHEEVIYGEEELDDVFESIQTQKEYRISYQELQEFIYGKDKVSMETLIYKLYQFINYYDSYQLLQEKEKYKQLGFAEFTAFLEQLNVKLEQHEREFLFKEFDKDGNGSIDLEEFRQGMNEIMWRYKHKRIFFENITGKTDRQLKPLPPFLLKIYQIIKDQHPSQQKFINIFGFYDTNKDGLINYQQFIFSMMKLQESSDEKLRLDGDQCHQIFKHYDSQFNSGFIQWEEIMLDMLQYDILKTIQDEQRDKEQEIYSFGEGNDYFKDKEDTEKEKEKYLNQFYFRLQLTAKQRKVDLSSMIIRNYDHERTELLDFPSFSELLNTHLHMHLRYEELQQLFMLFDSKKQYKINWV
eukprot:TRINITY_DN4640_c0_g1_i2.p1 TRINITY_DN4640_c0_g1~~TRINITY_DN4640_c0_g1_i2.p1  ORF type:complete len:515 (-),score=58.28 TRINITY_DN4640_c0_g1_i2:1644-3188(-)